MEQPACKLTLVYPPQAEDCLTELLLNSEPPLTGFTTSMAEGHGHDFATASIRERVRGRVKRGILAVVIPRDRLTGLLEDIRTRAPITNLAYWVEPVESFGRLAPVDAPSGETAMASLPMGTA